MRGEWHVTDDGVLVMRFADPHTSDPMDRKVFKVKFESDAIVLTDEHGNKSHWGRYSGNPKGKCE
jgi:hypothetical protein